MLNFEISISLISKCILGISYLRFKLTYSSNAQEKASVAEFIFRGLEFSWPLKRC